MFSSMKMEKYVEIIFQVKMVAKSKVLASSETHFIHMRDNLHAFEHSYKKYELRETFNKGVFRTLSNIFGGVAALVELYR